MKPLEFIKKIPWLFYKSGYNLVWDDGIEQAGYMTFIIMLAVFPFVVFFIATLGFLGQTDVGAEFIAAILNNVPSNIKEAVEPRITEIISGPPQGLLTVAILGTLWTASSAVEATRTILNRAYRVKNPPNYAVRRALSIVQLILMTGTLIMTLMALVFVPALITDGWEFISKFGEDGGDNLTVVQFFGEEWLYVRYGISYLMVLLFISSLYYLLPNIRQSFIHTLPGALITLILWLYAIDLVTIYVSNIEQINLVYGSLAGMIAFLLFIFIMNIIFIYGAEFNYLLEKTLGYNIEEKE